MPILGITLTRSLFTGAAIFAGGCSFGMTDADLATQLLSVSPRGGAAGVSSTPDIVLSFSGPMMPGMEQYLALHQGPLTGTEVPVSCIWSDDQETLTCRPTQPLAPTTVYTIHMKGGIVDANGEHVGMQRYGMPLGGELAGDATHHPLGSMGAGWHTPTWSRGMQFQFITR